MCSRYFLDADGNNPGDPKANGDASKPSQGDKTGKPTADGQKSGAGENAPDQPGTETKAGQGDLALQPFMAALQATGYDELLSLEIFSDAESRGS